MLTFLVILYFCALVHATCPSGCGDSASCCEVEPNKFSCCPYANGVCCADTKHCCPQGSVCDATGLSCKYPIGPQWPVRVLYDPDAKKGTDESLPSEKGPYVICPDRLSFCSRESTCCPMSDGRWGCCEHAHGICCSDGGHCCPANSRCNPKDGTCLPLTDDLNSSSSPMNKSTASTNLFQRRPAGGEKTKTRGMNASNHVCDGTGRYSCPVDTTCCRESTGDWGCCPLVDAVCCSDGLHCCPKNTVCSLKTGSCVASSGLEHQDGRSRMDADTVKSSPVTTNSSEQICADGRTRCSDLATCCRLADHKSYGCCPLKEGVCCLDGLHCCPKNYKCSLKESTCVGDDADSSSTTVNLSPSKTPLVNVPSSLHPEEDRMETCPGGLVSCPSGTCCLTALGNYRCCPYKSGVCCPDSEHCCPANSVCSSSTAGGCLLLTDRDRNSDGRAQSQSIPTTVITGHGKQKEVVFCPGQDFYCPNATTCCLGQDNGWSCCPYRNAMCCADRSHCCPPGTMCSVSDHGCLPLTSESVDQVRVRPSTPVSELHLSPHASSSVCADRKTICDDDMPCCQLVDGQWGCCPLSHGVCCANANNCCPTGTRCTGDGYCSAKGQFYSAPYLIPGRLRGPGKQETFLRGVEPNSFHFPMAETAQPATRDLMLLSASYRRMKEFHHSVCPSGVHRCAEQEQCCLSDRHGYTCAPKTSTCCSPSLDTVCPVGKVCSSLGMICNPV